MSKRIGIFGWGIIAPKSPNIAAFRENLKSAESWLTPFNGFGPDNFLVGTPEFRFEDYRAWIDQRFPPRHFGNLQEKMDLPALYAMGAFIQALDQNSKLEAELQALGPQTHVYLGTGLGSLETTYRASIALYESQKRWNHFWAQPQRNSKLREYLQQPEKPHGSEGVPPHPTALPEEDRDAAEQAWSAYWMALSDGLRSYLAELAEIESVAVEGEIQTGKLNAIREKEKRRTKLDSKWGAPDPPWRVSANLIWNIHNIAASQISILGRITGSAFAPTAACSTFGVALRLAMRAIQSGDARAVVVGATDPPPHPLTVGSFYTARVLASGGDVSAPLTRLKGTHVAGGAAVWIVGDLEYFQAKGFKPLGMEPIAVGVTSDAHHIITPTAEGPRAAMQQALAEAGASPADIATWDLHATATPGDYSEINTLRSVFADDLLVTARKGTFGHGMSAGGGWELTAQYLGYEAGQLLPTPLSKSELNTAIAEVHDRFVFNLPCEFPSGMGGKLSMGIGGINACVVSRPYR